MRWTVRFLGGPRDGEAIAVNVAPPPRLHTAGGRYLLVGADHPSRPVKTVLYRWEPLYRARRVRR